MSAVSSTLSEITGALSDAAPYAGAIEALATLGIDITKLVNPEQNYDAQFQSACQQAANLVTDLVEKPGADSDSAFTTFDDELLADTGRPVVGGIPTELVTIRVDRLLNHECCIAELRLYRQLFTEINNAARQQQPPEQVAGAKS